MLDINNIAFTFLNYPMSWLEILGTVTGLASVILAARAKASNYPVGLINIFFFIVLFYQVQLYSDMILQFVFAVISVIGFIKWVRPKSNEANIKHQLKISWMKPKDYGIAAVSIIAGTAILGTFMSHIHEFFPVLLPAAYPYPDSFVMAMSVAAMILMAKKKVESWICWIIVDVVCVFLFYFKGIMLMSVEYGIFLGIATYGLVIFIKQFKKGL
jgi:nicotinamide mononucleotide transporter